MSIIKKSPKCDLRAQYKRVIQLGLVLSLAIHILLLQGYKKLKVKSVKREVKFDTIQVEEIPQTQQEKTAPAPTRPTVPIASEDEDLPDDATIDDTEWDIDDEAPPPPPPPESDDDDVPLFVPYDEPPSPIGGYAAIQRKLVYPEIAKKAGIEGRVVIQALVDENGVVKRTKVAQSLGPNGCDEAAINAIMAVKWKPAMQRDMPVKVWVSVPVIFKLK
ncbi:energy transducer TonB [candidate division KSB1 bacterium]|nr:MAG: energy transducer TonB [candidate division KSB1 bacterium]